MRDYFDHIIYNGNEDAVQQPTSWSMIGFSAGWVKDEGGFPGFRY